MRTRDAIRQGTRARLLMYMETQYEYTHKNMCSEKTNESVAEAKII